MSSIVPTAFANVEIFNVTINHFHSHVIPDVERLMVDLRAEREALELRLALKSSHDALQKSGIDLNVLFGKLLDIIKPGAFATEVAYSRELLNAMQSGAALLEMYEQVSAKNVGFGDVLRDHLAKRIEAFYRESKASQVIDTEWLCNAMFYDWLIANKLLDDPQLERWGPWTPRFSTENLKAFELKYVVKIAKAIKEITAANGGRCYMPSPHRDATVNNYFEAHKLQQSQIKDMGAVPEQQRLGSTK
ncbi:hypothetical protein [Burkholderia ubonensis]|uniref:hypothetical protein n=1 Tax=Burkholderia ubonensis TaxID=101571 RepID=UPI00075E9B99|nr:hypothetical protein [Burkholderia ubonensis]KWN15842.1 hypothetical protein WM21_11745 [Burkholderia ubonensis]